MKLVYSTRDVLAASFLEQCVLAHDYGLSGFEIYNPLSERAVHGDSIFRGNMLSDAKRKLRNRMLAVAALRFPQPADDESVTSHHLLSFVEMADHAGVEQVILTLSGIKDTGLLKCRMGEMLRFAERTGIEVLLETVGPLAVSETAVSLIRDFASVSLGISWNVRATCFDAGESVETTIKTLGAYIRYVRLGDRKNGKNVLLGEGDLPLSALLSALRSLNYEGFICADWNEEIRHADVVLTHFVHTLNGGAEQKPDRRLQYNRAGTGTFPWPRYEQVDLTFSQVLDEMVKNYPDQAAFKYTTLDYTRTYTQFRDDVDRAAAAFIALGVKPGYHVAVWATNVPQWFITFWAAVKIGAVLVTVNTAYRIHEIEYLLRQSDTHTLVMIENYKDVNYRSVMEELCPELFDKPKDAPLYAGNLPFLRNIVTVGFEMTGCITWEEMLKRGASVPLEEVRRRAAAVKPDDVCNMQYTSGTTGFPKGVMLTHNNIVNNGKTIGDRMDLSTADRMMIQVPMFHCFGMVLSMTSMMTHGGTLSPLPYFSPKSSLACINQERITCFNGVPTMFLAMFNHADFAATDFSHMRTGIMAGANCPPELMRRAAAEMNMTEILSVYGQTESAPGCTMGEVNEDIYTRTDTVGSAFPGVECRIIDPETGAELPDGMPGEFVARGYNIMKGYYKMPEATAQTIDGNGWLHTGDICMRDERGYYKVTGRLKDMIIRGGENIYPREIEEFYLTNPKIRDVQVIGVPDKNYGEEACAYVILHDGAQADAAELTAFGRAHIARHKVPRYFIFTDAFPLNAAGKVLKYKMKEDAAARLGL